MLDRFGQDLQLVDKDLPAALGNLSNRMLLSILT